MVAPSPNNLQLRAWIRDFILGSDELTDTLKDQIVAVIGTVLTAQGDLLSRGSSDVERRALGTTGQIPIVGSGDWAWGAISSLLATGDDIHGEIAFPEDKTYTIILDSKVARTITEVTVKTSAGTATVTPKIGSTALGGGASSAASTKSSVTHSSDNTMAVNSTLTFVLSSTSSDCENLSFSIKCPRSFAA